MDKRLYKELLAGKMVPVINRKKTRTVGVEFWQLSISGLVSDTYWIDAIVNLHQAQEQAKASAYEALPENLREAFKYKPLPTWVMPWISIEYAKHDVEVEYNGITLTRWFTALPEYHAQTQMYHVAKDGTLEPYLDIGELQSLSSLYAEITLVYGTPYVDEILALREIRKLPMPIADAIADCMRAVQMRRFCFEHDGSHYPLASVETWKKEVLYTYADMYGEVIRWPKNAVVDHMMTWEDAAKFIHGG